jgi:uncharacterized protein (TIGR03118 family)
MPRSFARVVTLTLSLGLIVLLASSMGLAQSYHRNILVSNLSGKAPHTDPLLMNPWGLAFGAGGPFWVSDEDSGHSTLYDGKGNPQSLQVVIPPASGTGPGTPTGIVFNGSSEFKVQGRTSVFLFATLDGTISGWSALSPSAAAIAVTQTGAVYTGLAITNKASGNFLYAADSANNKVDVYDGSFNLVQSFTDPKVPAGFAPFGIRDIAGQVYVTFANTAGGTGGVVDIFGEDGTLVKHLAHGSPLNQPWGLAIAPSNFGPLSSTLLVSNNTSTGTINGFDLTTGAFVGTITNSLGRNITISGLWALVFGGGTPSDGLKNQLFFTAGPSDTNGFFGMINFH